MALHNLGEKLVGYNLKGSKGNIAGEGKSRGPNPAVANPLWFAENLSKDWEITQTSLKLTKDFIVIVLMFTIPPVYSICVQFMSYMVLQ